jgi:hypothetical protein
MTCGKQITGAVGDIIGFLTDCFLEFDSIREFDSDAKR